MRLTHLNVWHYQLNVLTISQRGFFERDHKLGAISRLREILFLISCVSDYVCVSFFVKKTQFRVNVGIGNLFFYFRFAALFASRQNIP